MSLVRLALRLCYRGANAHMLVRRRACVGKLTVNNATLPQSFNRPFFFNALNFLDKDGSSDTSQNDLESKKNYIQKKIKIATERKEKRLRSLNRQLEESQRYANMRLHADLLIANMSAIKELQREGLCVPGQKTAVELPSFVEGEPGVCVEIDLVKFRSVNEQCERMYYLAKKYDRTPSVIAQAMNETLEAQKAIKEIEEATNRVTTDQEISDLIDRVDKLVGGGKKKEGAKLAEKKSKSDERFWKYVQPNGDVIYVGRNKKGNEFLSLKFGKSEDYWMHAEGCPGSHVIIRSRPGPPSKETLRAAADLAILYSKASGMMKAKVTVSQVKHVSKPRGAPTGMVSVRRQLFVATGRPRDAPTTRE